MNECYIKDDKVIISEWYRKGGMAWRRDALAHTHPQSMVQCLIRLGEDVTKYGYHYCTKCKHIEKTGDNK